jgi:hypothetical protein
MSHVTEVKTVFNNLDVLAEACDRLGLELQRGKKRFAWWGTFQNDSSAYGNMRPEQMGKCDHAIRVKGDTPHDGPSGPWEVGLVQQEDGSFRPYYDTFGGAGNRLTERVGQQAARLKQEYTVVQAERTVRTGTLARQGFGVKEREALPNGWTRLKVRRR